MIAGQIVRFALRGLAARRLRSALTMLGVVIGVACVITMAAIGQGTQEQVTAQISSLGPSLVIAGINNSAKIHKVKLTRADVAVFATRAEAVRAFAPVISTQDTMAVNGHKADWFWIDGTTASFPMVRNFHPASGRFLADMDLETRAFVVVLGADVASFFYPSSDPVGQTLLISGTPFRVVGVMEPKGALPGVDNNSRIFMPITTFERFYAGDDLSVIYALARTPALVPRAVAEIGSLIQVRMHRAAYYWVQSQQDVLNTVGSANRSFTLMLVAIAGVSLLVGGIGIMNIMLVAVSERTREIGIRKAVGARRSDILLQFLAEAVVLSVLGGLGGLLLGIAGAQIIASQAGWPVAFPPMALVLALLFALLEGLVFGVYPAFKASQLDPIVALRYE